MLKMPIYRLNKKIGVSLRNLKLFPRLYLFFIVCCFIPMLILFVIIFSEIQTSYIRGLRSGYVQSLNIFASSADNLMQNINTEITVIATSSKTHNRILKENITHDFTYQSIFNKVLLAQNSILTIELTSIENVLESVPFNLLEQKMYSSKYIRNAASSDSLRYWQYIDLGGEDIFDGPSGLKNQNYNLNSIIVTMAVKNALTGMRIGFVNFILDPKIFDNMVQDLNKNVYGQADNIFDYSIIDDNDIIVFSTCYEIGSMLDTRISKVATENEIISIDLSGEKYSVLMRGSNETNLRFICTVREKLIQSLSPFVITYLVLTVFLILFAGYTATIFIRSIMTPIRNLMSNMREYGNNGNHSYKPVLDHYNDEISELVQNYNKAIKLENILKKTLIEQEKKRQEAEYSALTSLINPHFLYNTLDMINWKAYSEGQDNVANSIQQLSEFFRLTQKSTNKPYLLKDEIKLTQCYCNIQKEKNGNRIQFQFNIAPNTLSYPVINIILQPLVENAIFHGILSHNLKFGTVIICAYLKDSKLVLEVKDNGKGIVNNLKDSNKIISCYGLESIKKRLWFSYGNESALNLFPNPTGGTIAQIVIPIFGGKNIE